MIFERDFNPAPEIVEAIGARPVLNQEEQAQFQTYHVLRQTLGVEEAEHTFRTMFSQNDADSILNRLMEFEVWMLRHDALVMGGAVIQGPDEEDWYIADVPPDKHWNALKAKLSQDPSWSHAVTSIDESSKIVVSKLGNPQKQTIKTRGLVVGYVQSGKTANYSATIAKAADRGYKLFIILSGMHTGLRRQTQRRMTKDLVNLNPENWVELTTEYNDIGNPGGTAWLMQDDKVGIAVVKKNASRLKKLNNWLNEASANHHLENAPILIIDDECDQASPNAHRDPEESRTAINKLIVDLLTGKRATYVGYTASPFANFVINPLNDNDIYPRNFIYPLPKPEGYFGGEDLFGLSGEWFEDELEEDPEYDVFREIPPEEATLYNHRAENFVPQVTPNLNDAIIWFVLATAIRLNRENGRMMHSSMLMHTTHNISPHLEFGQMIEKHIEGLRNVISEDFGKGRFRDVWEKETTSVPAEDFNLTAVDFEDVYSYVPQVLSKLQVIVDNSLSNDRLDYDDNNPAPLIVVGGNTLSRGLTLEGLVCSFFLRNGRQYDSLMQMGRWYGYRPGYGDLARIWTTAALRNQFSWLAKVEFDIRQQLELYAQSDANPLTVPVQILRHPTMQMTARNKLYFAVTAAPVSFSGRRIQTLYLNPRDRDIAQKNLAALRKLAIDGGIPTKHINGIFYGDVDANTILEFLDSYCFATEGEAQSEKFTEYITEQNESGRILKWNVLIATPQQQKQRPTVNLGDHPLLENVITSTRTAMKNGFGSTDETVYLKALDSASSRTADWPSAIQQPSVITESKLLEVRNTIGKGLLVIYLIDKDSSPKPPPPGKISRRKKLDAIDHQVGLALSFPSAHPDTEIPDALVVNPEYIPELLVPESADEERFEDDDGDANLSLDNADG